MSGREHAPREADEVRAFFTSWIDSANAGAWEDFAALMHPDIVLSDPMSARAAVGRSEALTRAQQQYEPFPDGRTEMVGDPFVALAEPRLAYHWRFTGTHLKPVSPPGFAPTGNHVEVEGTSVLRFHDRKVIEATLYFDTTQVARQLLAAPREGSPLEGVMVVAQRLRVKLRRGGRDRTPVA